MRLLPGSLRGRLALTLIVGLLAAQLLGLAIVLHDRGAALYQASGLQTAQNAAALVDLLDTLTPPERERVARAFSTRVQHLALSDLPHPLPPREEQDSQRTAMLGALLRRTLGDRPIRVAVTDAPPGRSHPQAAHLGWRPHPFVPWRRASFIVQVQLRDGTWASLERRLPPELFALPQRLFISLAILLASVLALSLLVVRWLTRPLAVLARAADALGRDIHRPPLPEEGSTEVRHAARAFNRMQASLQRYLQDRERMLAAVSHDLKTPITRLRLRTEALGDDALRTKFEHDLDDMEAMVLATLEFMRSAADKETLQPVDINALLASLQADFEEVGHPVRVEGTAHSPVRAKPLALKRALANLLDNATKYGHDVAVDVRDRHARVEITVTDRGPGIPPDQLERVFEPFYRIEGSRSRDTGGVGLGLGIARNIARLHGGDLVLRNRAGGGLEAHLVLPRRD